MDKVEHYKWAKPGDMGKFAWVHLGEINFDESYQRPVLELASLKIARDFRWEAFGAIVLMKRKHGALFCVDGRQRVSAATRRGDIRKVPSMIYESDGPEHEAKAFLALNTCRGPVKALFKYRGQLAGRMEPAVSIDHFLTLNGLAPGLSGDSPNTITFISTLMETWAKNAEASKRAILTQKGLGQNSVLNVYVHKGLYYLLCNNVSVEDSVKKLIKAGGLPRLIGSIRNYATAVGEHLGFRVCGMAILSVINKGKTSKRIHLESLE